MEKLKMHSPNLTQDNIARIRDLFPGCVTEAKGEDGSVKLAVDFDQLRQELADSIVEGPQERYHLNWPGKREALLTANAPIAKTLRPVREESVDFDTTKNLFIEGDNLDALKLLQETYLGKVKMIYIDPPYNTGKDFVYRDNFSETTEDYFSHSLQTDEIGNRLVANRDSNGRFHSVWLSSLYSRLIIARNLLRQDGVVIISIDEVEHSNLRRLCDEIFGSQNFCGEIVWKNSSKNDQSFISVQHEYFVVYVRDKQANSGEWLEKKQGLDEIYKAFEGFKKDFGFDWKKIHQAALDWQKELPASSPILDSKHYSWMDERGVYFPDNISGPNDGQYVYDVDHPITGKKVKQPSRGWFCPKEKLVQLISENRVHFGPDESTVPCLKTYLKNTEYVSLTSLRVLDSRAASNRLRDLFGEKIFTNPKDELLLADFFRAMNVKDNDIVLDFYAGSGSTAHAIWALNRSSGSNCRWISVQIAENLLETLTVATGAAKKITQNAIRLLNGLDRPTTIAEISKERLRRAGKLTLAGKVLNGWGGDIGFRVFKVETSNMADVYYSPDALDNAKFDLFVDNIKPDRTPEDLLFQVMLDWGVDLALPINKQSIQGKDVFFVDGNALAACFDASGSIDEAFVKELAKYQPLRVVFRDAGYKNSAIKINVEQIFKLLSPATEVKCI
ncbi:MULTISPECIES: site-specific DNA-methyltransferase [Rahnella]|uniref:site-specific DNA-methyltransferase n=1 Tax=Rahnella sp. 2050 TaxID=3156425 RepID=UPI001B6FDCBC|nr:adenine-specific DNA-methyltransferase [Rahnella aquatilis]GKX42991.1 site-specific DNA-methyltransferase [Pectobacterium carotovorum subsp. carotovorum]GLX55855.1 site-specific DNA-methyltransferase [Pectobacterium carotovorum subsp. carotovorum]